MKIVLDSEVEYKEGNSALRKKTEQVSFSTNAGFDNVYINTADGKTYIVNKKEFMIMLTTIRELV